MMKSVWMIVWREGIRLLRSRGTIAAVIGTPLVLWLVLGSGFGSLFEQTYLKTKSMHYFFPGVLLMVVLFSSVFAMISIIEDRNEGFLQGVRLVPQAAQKIVLGKVLAASLWAVVQAWVLLLLSPLAGFRLTLPGVLEISLLLFVAALFLSSLGFIFAWWLNSVQGFHAVMNVILFPLWLLSGALFPFETATAWMQKVMYYNPLRMVLDALREVFYVQFSLVNFVTSPQMLSVLGLMLLMVFVQLFVAWQMVAHAGVRGAPLQRAS